MVKFFSASFLLSLLLGVTVGNGLLQIHIVQSSFDRQVKQAGLLIISSSVNIPAQDGTFRFPFALLRAMNFSVDILQADTTQITNATLYDGDVGKYAVIFIGSYWDVLDGDIDSNELAILDAYELKFGVAEVLAGPTQNPPAVWKTRYGIVFSEAHAAENITRVRWLANNLIETVNIKGTNFTLAANAVVYASMGDATSQTMPYLWSYTDPVGRIRVTGIANAAGGEYVGEDEAYTMPTWLGLKLSSANKVIRYYWSLDIDDINLPPFGNQHMTGDDLQYVYDQFTPTGLEPTLNIFIGSVGVLYDLRTRFPSFYNKLVELKDFFEIGIHPNLASPMTYSYALNNIKVYHSNLSSWDIPSNLLYLATDGHTYSTTTALAIQDVGYRFIAQLASQSSDTPPNCKYPKYDISATNLFRIPRMGFLSYNSQNMSSALSQSGFATWGEYYRYHLKGTYRNYGTDAGYVAWFTHEINYMQDYPAIQIFNSLQGIGVAPITYVSSPILAHYLRFTQDYDFTVTYNMDAQTLTYDITKQNGNAENEMMLILPPSSTIASAALAVFSQKSYTAMLLAQTSRIDVTLGQTYPAPYITRYTTRLTSTTYFADRFSFTLMANLSGFTSVTKVFVGEKGEPKLVFVDDLVKPVNYDSATRTVTIAAKHVSISTEIIVDWNPHKPVASFFYSPLNPKIKDIITFNASGSQPLGGYIVSYQWDFGDWSLGQGIMVSHTYNSPGTYIVTLNVTDSEQLWNSTTAILNVRMPLAPFVWDVEQQPEFPNYDEGVTIKANITSSESALNVVILTYSNGSSWTNMTMTLEKQLYIATIPALAYQTSIQYRIYAFNDAGSWTPTSLFNYTVADKIPPSIRQVNWSPLSPSPDEDVVVYAQVGEHPLASGVRNVTLWWGARHFGEGIQFSMVVMETEGDSQKASIPRQSAGSVILFFIESYDISGNRARSETYSFIVKTTSVDPSFFVLFAAAATLTVFIAAVILIRRRRNRKGGVLPSNQTRFAKAISFLDWFECVFTAELHQASGIKPI